MLLVFLFVLLGPPLAQAQITTKIAVLPFRIHALEPLDHLKQGLQAMFSTRLADKGFPVVTPDVVNKHPLAFLPLFQRSDILTIGKALKADAIITGSLTQVGRRISLDIKAWDVNQKKPPFTLFMVEDDIDNLTLAADRAATSLFNQILGVEQIDSIQVKGNKRIEREAILAVIESRRGESLDYDLLDKDLRAIFRMGYFTDVQTETEDGPKGKIVTFIVTEKPSIGRITFQGNKKLKDEDLKKEVAIKRFTILNRSEIRQSINRLKEFYRLKGYYNVVINEKIEEMPKNEVSLLYEIQEGEKVYITKIKFVGNTKFDNDDLTDIMETSEKGLLSWFTKSGLLDKKLLEFDLHKVTSFYHNHGYIRAKTGEPQIAYVQGDGLHITIEVVEGPRYEVNNVGVEGDLIMPAEALLEMVMIKKEKFFNREVVRKDTLLLREVYSDQGFAYAEVAPFTKEDDENRLVDITYKATKGKKVRFERINIAGNTFTRDKVIRRELRVIEGEEYSGTNLKKSTRNLHRLGFFEDVQVQTKKGSQDDLMVLDVNVKERATGAFSLGAGYSSFESIMGVFSISQNNLLGRGHKLSASGRIGARTTQFDIRFTEPWFLDKPISAGIDLYKWEREFDEYTKDSFGAALRFKFPVGLDEFTRVTAKYGYDDADIFDIDDTAAVAIQQMKGTNVTSSITTGIERDSRNLLWATTKGSINSFSIEYAGGFMGGDVAFNKYLARTAWFFPLPWETVFLAQGRWGFVDDRPDDGILPIFQKFRIGGINTVRGFEFADISPEDPETGDKIGGEYMMVYNLEYRFPLAKEQGVTGLVFFDAGNVLPDADGFTFNDIRKSIGTGVRWYSPFGPLRLEYGFILDPEPEDDRGNFEFAVGGSF